VNEQHNAAVTAALVNADGTGNVYITSNPSLNRLTLRLSVATDEAVGFPAGKPLRYGSLPSGASAIYVFFDGLLANGEVAAIDFSARGWSAATFVDPASTLGYLVLAPDAEVRVAGGGALDLSLDNVLVAESPASGTATVSLAGATGITAAQGDVSLFVNIADPPKPPDQSLDLEIGFGDPTVYTGHDADLVLHLINPGGEPLVPGGAGSWGAQPPTFQLTLVYGDGPGALSTLADAHGIVGAIANGYGNVWKPVAAHRQGERPYWTMQPDPGGGGMVLGSGEHGTIEFRFSGIRTALPKGLDSAITLAYVSWSSVPGFRDGARALPITKRHGPGIATFYADPAIVPFGQRTVQTTLTWQADHADEVSFDVPGVPTAELFKTSGRGPLDGGITASLGSPLKVTAFKRVNGATGADAQLTATRTIAVGGVERSEITTGVPTQHGALLVIPSHGRVAYLFFAGDPRFAAVDLTTRKMAPPTDLRTVVKSPLTVRATLCAAVSPDGATLYVAIDADGQTAWLLEISIASGAVVRQSPLGGVTGPDQIGPISLVSAPDGKTLYASTIAVRFFSSGQSHGWWPEPYEALVIDAQTGAVTARHPWVAKDPLAGPFVGVLGDGPRLLCLGRQAVSIVDLTSGIAVDATLNLEHAELGAIVNAVLAPDGRRAYVQVLDVSRPHEETVDVALLVIDVDPARRSLTLARRVEIGKTGPFTVIAAIIEFWVGSWMALSADGRTLCCALPPGAVATIATSEEKEDVRVWPCSTNEDFTPVVVATAGDSSTIYATLASGPFVVLSLVG
jgi:hypothetical protein